MSKMGLPREYKSHGKVIGYRIQWTMPDGKRKGKTFPFTRFDGNRAEARQAAVAELRRVWGELQAIADGRSYFDPEAERQTLKEFFTSKWKKERTVNRNRPEANDQLFAHLECIEHWPVRRIQRDAVELVLAELRKKNLSKGTQQKVLGFLRMILNHAKRHDPLVNPPSTRGILPSGGVFENEILESKNQVDAFLGAVDRDDALALYAVAIYAGLRAGELAGLRWVDIEIHRQQIHVRHSYNHLPKNGKTRVVPIFDNLLPFLKDWVKQAESTEPDDLVFPSTSGVMLRHDNHVFRELYHQALKRAHWPEKDRHELPCLRFHDLRHTFASQWLMDGGGIYQLMKMGGWSSYKMIEDRYAKYIPSRYKGTDGMFGLTRSAEPSKTKPKKKTDSEQATKRKRKTKSKAAKPRRGP